MSGYRSTFLQYTNQIAKTLSTKFLIRASGEHTFHVFYHGISDSQETHIKHLYPVKTITAFKKDLDFLLAHLQPISLNALLSEEKQQTTKPRFTLSFDDGLSSFYTTIAPILEEKGIPAICYLNSAFVDNKALFYRYKASLLIEAISSNNIKNSILSQWEKNVPSQGISIVETILGISYEHREFLDDLANAIGVDFSVFLKETQPYLSTAQIKALQNRGFQFGFHSVDHPEYQFLSLEEQLDQTIDCAKVLAQQFAIKEPYFSFPFTDYGVSSSFFEAVSQHYPMRATFGTAGQKQDTMEKHFQRIPLEHGTLSAKEIFNSELVYCILRKKLGKNLIQRA